VAQATYHPSEQHGDDPGAAAPGSRRSSTRLRGAVAAIGCLVAVLLTSIGRSPIEGVVDMAGLTVWALGIVAGLVAFVCAVSVFFDVAERFDATP
jgi:VIT1/CCC1 family predicted Fe2+/Mn2+ transporter